MTRRTLTHTLPRVLLAGAIGSVLANCGGGSGDDGSGASDPNGVGDIVDGELLGNRDVNGDGITDISVNDIDGDGFEDYDINGDGNFDTKLGDTNFDGRTDFDANGDGERDFDIDGDGSVDLSVLGASGFLEGYSTNGDDDVPELDIDGTPIDNTPVPGALTCPGGGDDATSSDDQWNNNCTLTSGATSYYTRGVQRVLYCLGFGGGATQIGDFADAQYGGGTAGQVRAYQTDRGLLPVDGIVGPVTWQALRDELEVLPETSDNIANRDRSYAVAGENAIDDVACTGQVQFYREFADGSDSQFGGWSIADNPGSTTRVEFSIRNPFVAN